MLIWQQNYPGVRSRRYVVSPNTSMFTPPCLPLKEKPRKITTILLITYPGSFFLHENYPLRWRHNGRDGVSNHQPHDCLLNSLFGRRSKKTWKFRVTGLCAGKLLDIVLEKDCCIMLPLKINSMGTPEIRYCMQHYLSEPHCLCIPLVPKHMVKLSLRIAWRVFTTHTTHTHTRIGNYILRLTER